MPLYGPARHSWHYSISFICIIMFQLKYYSLLLIVKVQHQNASRSRSISRLEAQQSSETSAVALHFVVVHLCLHVAIVVSLIMPRLHYGNATLAGLPEYQHRRLQSVLNAAARLIYRKSQCQHDTPLLRELHWLRSRDRLGL